MSVSGVWFFFFFKQKTAYGMRISDWGSDGCSSDLRASGRAATAARDAGRVGIGWYEGQDFGTADALLDSQAVAGQRLAADDVAQVVGEMLARRETAGLGVEMRTIEAPAEPLTAALLAHEAVQPAPKTACTPERVTVDGEDPRVVEDR